MNLYRVLADVVVVVHAAFVGTVVLGLLLILVGLALRWRWVRNFWFRAVHFLMIAVVVGQALLGIVCPLTTLENHLRELGGQEPYPGSFIGYWAHELIFYDGPPWAFTLGYCIFGAAVLTTLLAAPPRWPWRKSPPAPDATAGG
jgi:hypothetical protein